MLTVIEEIALVSILTWYLNVFYKSAVAIKKRCLVHIFIFDKFQIFAISLTICMLLSSFKVGFRKITFCYSY